MTNYLADLDRGLEHFRKTRPVYQKREDYQEGNIAEAFGSRAIRRSLKATLDRYKLNFAASPADALMRRVKISSTSISKGVTAQDDLLDMIVDDNELEEDLDFWMKKAAYLGDYYVLIEPGEEPTDVEIIGKSPFSTAILYSERNAREVSFGVQKWKSGDRTRVNLYYDDETYQMISKEKTRGAKAADFVPFMEEDRDPESPTFGQPLDPKIVNDFGFPLFHLRVDDKPYGCPVNAKAYGPQDAITKLVSTHMGAVDFQGFPQRYALAEIDTDKDDAGEDFGDGESEQLNPTANKSKLTSGPGEVWWLDGVKEVGQFATADGKTFTDDMIFYIRVMAKVTDTPLYEFDTNGAEPSGESRRRADGPINDHARMVRRSFTVSISTLLEYAMRVAGHDGLKVEVAWEPAETVTDKEGWEVFALKVKNGVPLRQALLEAGYSKEQVEEWYPDNAIAISIDAASTLSEVFASLGKASAAGIAGADDATAWFPGFLTAARPEPTPPPVQVVAAPMTPDPSAPTFGPDGALVDPTPIPSA